MRTTNCPLRKDIIVAITVPLDIEFVHEIERAIDGALIPLGFSRFGTAKEQRVTELRYWQFGVCQRETDEGDLFHLTAEDNRAVGMPEDGEAVE